MEYKCLYHKTKKRYIYIDVEAIPNVAIFSPEGINTRITNNSPSLVPNTDYFNFNQDYFFNGEMTIYDHDSDEDIMVKKEDCEVHVFSVTLKETKEV